MTDQCKHCGLRGKLEECKKTDCTHHENWCAVEQQKLIDSLTQQLEQSQASNARYFDAAVNLNNAADEALSEDGKVGIVPIEYVYNLAKAINETTQQSLNHIKAQGVRDLYERYSNEGFMVAGNFSNELSEKLVPFIGIEEFAKELESNE